MRSDGDVELPFNGHIDPGSRLVRAAHPVLDRLAGALVDTATSVVLADASARIVDRRAGDRSLRRRLDAVCAAPGFSYAERDAGTNGLGTVAEERRPVQVVGGEHFADWLSHLTCVGVPLRHPTTGRLEGVLDLTCRVGDTSPLMMPMVLEAAREIEQRLYEETSFDERLLLERFLAASKGSSRPLVSLNDHLVIVNPAAARILSPADHVLLREWVAAGGRAGSEAVLADGTAVALRCSPVLQDERRTGALIELAVRDAPPPSPLPAQLEPVLPGLAGRTPPWRRACAAVLDYLTRGVPLLLFGEPGVGKLALARAAHQGCVPAGPLTVLDASLVPVDGLTPWLAAVRVRLGERAGTVVVRHLEALDPSGRRALAGLVDEAGTTAPDQPGPVVIATLTTSRPPEAADPLLSRLCGAVKVPALRERPDDIADLLTVLARRHGPHGADVRFAPEAIGALVRADWPGNVRQLEGVVHYVCARGSSADVRVADLPPTYRENGGGRALTAMERLERDAIVTALAEAGGNKAEAVAHLGISRATLYRKIRSLGIPVDPHLS